jgi:murein L,D-transpeptidase YcbB/YkuD
VAGTLLRNAEVVVWIDGVSRQLTTDAEGQLKVTIPRRAREGRIVVEAMEGLPEGLKAELRVGGLDPVSHLRGQVQRLHNLGFLTWNLEPDAISTPKDQSFLMAVEKFQHKHKLQVDGICGRRTQAKLLEVHGS